MKKLALFVEGLTEQLFLEKLFIEIAGAKNIIIVSKMCYKTRNGKRVFKEIKATGASTKEREYYVLINDSGGESSVNSDIRDSCESLSKAGYEKILGLRDVAPNWAYTDIPKLERSLRYGIPTKFIPFNILLAVMEVEAWFVAETTHYGKIDPNITLSKIIDLLSFNPKIDDVEKRPMPSEDLDKIYNIAKKAYPKKKNRRQITRTINAIDYNEIYFNLRSRIYRLNRLISEIDDFLQ